MRLRSYLLVELALAVVTVPLLAQVAPVQADDVKLAEVEVSSAQSVDLDDAAGWSQIPEYLAGAKIFAKDPKGRELECTIKSDGIAIIAASWTYDGNPSGGWAPTRTTKEQLIGQGWIALDDLVWNEKDTHTLFFRQVKAGEKFKFHTRKYNQPFLVEADAGKIAAASERFAKAAAEAKAKEALAAKPGQKPAEPHAEAKGPAREEIKVAGTNQVQLTSEEVWSPLPEFLRGATAFQQAKGNTIDLNAARDVQVVVAASWAYDGNDSGGWYEGRTTLLELVAAGWDPIGTIVQKDKGEHTLLRRTLKAGQQVKFHTRKHNAPVTMLVAPEKAALLAAAPKLSVASNTLAAIAPPKPRPTPPAGEGLILRAHEPDRQDRFARRGLLLRELVRQAILLAAREELGLSTRDDALRERGAGGEESGPLPLDVIVHVQDGGLCNVTVFHFVKERPEILWDKQFKLGGDDLILALTAEAERLSREELLATLKKAGYDGQANRQVEQGAADADARGLLADMHPLSQLAAARKLHRQLHEEGESPERLANLARAYANLGALTEHLCSPAFKAYKARALLYAERAAHRWPTAPSVLIGRAYARALVGLHQAALDDLAAAAALPSGGALAGSPHVRILEAFCKFELDKLDDPELPLHIVPLARTLKLMAIERFSGTGSIVHAAEQLLDSVPDSDRAIDAIFETGELGTRSQSAQLGGERTPQGLYGRLLELEDLPRRSAALAARAGQQDEAAERIHRLNLIRALRAEGELGADIGEPSWQAVAAWIEEVAFLQATRQMQFLANGLSVSMDETRESLAPLLADHPYYPLFETLTDSPVARRDRFIALVPLLRPQDATENEEFYWQWLESNGQPQGKEYGTLGFKHQDWLYRDLLYNVRNSREFAWPEYSGHLRRVSPYSPLTVASTVRFDWEYAAPHALEWEKKYESSPQVQGALGKQYFKQEKYDDAIRCFTRWAALQPDYEAYMSLAEAWSQKKDSAKFLATIDEYLQKDDYGLGHARARVEAANYLMATGKWDEAWPYAEAAAGSGAEWALQCAVDCLTGLKRWPEAERYAQASVERYPDTAPTWYFWCRRTGQGAVAAAEAYVRQVEAEPRHEINAWYHAVFLALVGENEKALAKYQEALKQYPSPTVAFEAALLAHELKQTDLRDQLLNTVRRSAVQPNTKRTDLEALARLVQEALADGSKLPAFAENAEAIWQKVNHPRNRCSSAYIAGKFLLLHDREAGDKFLTRAAAAPLSSPSAALAAAELSKRKP